MTRNKVIDKLKKSIAEGYKKDDAKLQHLIHYGMLGLVEKNNLELQELYLEEFGEQIVIE